MSFKDKIAKIKETTSPTLDKAKTKINEASDYVGGKSEQAKKAIVNKATEVSPEGVKKMQETTDKIKITSEKAIVAASEKVDEAKKTKKLDN